jgi:hypothetical protein
MGDFDSRGERYISEPEIFPAVGSVAPVRLRLRPHAFVLESPQYHT